MELKLNYKRTALIGFAFFGILLLWQVYDTWCPTLLTDLFARKISGVNAVVFKQTAKPEDLLKVQWLVGIVMACDNLAALILLPVFGTLSDRTKTPIGKRMPYILVGTFVAATAFPFIPLFFHNDNVVGMIIMMGLVLMFMMMYRNPAVALMPDITPKPLRAKANGIINIMGYFGGAFATVLGLVFLLTDYINATDGVKKLYLIEIPFVVASVLMVISALVLFFTIKENKITEEMKEELEEGERQAAIETPVDDNKPMPKENRNMLIAILAAEFLWFMADNGIGTYLGNYAIYYLKTASNATSTLVIIGGVASVIGFAIAGIIADKIGRKWTIVSGLCITTIAIFIMIFVGPTNNIVGKNGEYALPTMLYLVWAIKGFGMALVHNCSFPMVVELCSSKKIGKFTGFYYASSMSAQTVTPILIGAIFRATLQWKALPVYATTAYALSMVIFFLFVKNIKAKKVGNVKGLEALGDAD